MAPKGKADTAAQEWFDTVEQRVLVLPYPKGALFEACLALTLQCKNLYNTIHFAVRSVLTAYVWGREAGCWAHQAGTARGTDPRDCLFQCGGAKSEQRSAGEVRGRDRCWR
ncbi:hypothetical protein PO002_44480 [Cupriavidus necator]|uniref:hypothetical protein n=1 Tax=Cupriavidus necator TaxID=106590 RepID=UPI0039C1DDC8